MSDTPQLANPGEFISAEEYEESPEQQMDKELITSDWQATMEALSRPETKVTLPKRGEFSRQKVVAAFEDAFELIGGVPRLAVWAHSNPKEFYKLYGKLLPSTNSSALGESNELVIKHVLPKSRLDE